MRSIIELDEKKLATAMHRHEKSFSFQGVKIEEARKKKLQRQQRQTPAAAAAGGGGGTVAAVPVAVLAVVHLRQGRTNKRSPSSKRYISAPKQQSGTNAAGTDGNGPQGAVGVEQQALSLPPVNGGCMKQKPSTTDPHAQPPHLWCMKPPSNATPSPIIPALALPALPPPSSRFQSIAHQVRVMLQPAPTSSRQHAAGLKAASHTATVVSLKLLPKIHLNTQAVTFRAPPPVAPALLQYAAQPMHRDLAIHARALRTAVPLEDEDSIRQTLMFYESRGFLFIAAGCATHAILAQEAAARLDLRKSLRQVAPLVTFSGVPDVTVSA